MYQIVTPSGNVYKCEDITHLESMVDSLKRLNRLEQSTEPLVDAAVLTMKSFRNYAIYSSDNAIVQKIPKLVPNSVKKVIFNNPATIVIWSDNTKTVVKCQDGDDFDPEKGLAMAICKKVLGNKSNFNNVFKKYVDPYYEELPEYGSFVDALSKALEEIGAKTIR